MIQFFNVNLNYSQKEILKHITFKIDKSEFVYIIGPSGAGKSSIINLINFAQFPDSGTVIVNEYSSAKIKQKQIFKCSTVEQPGIGWHDLVSQISGFEIDFTFMSRLISSLV